MKDNELRAIVLQKYYELRERGYFQWCEVELDDQFPITEIRELGRICEWKPVRGACGMTVGGIGKISALGVDVVEGVVKAPITITFDHSRTVSVHDSPNAKVQVGNHNSASDVMNVVNLHAAIDRSGFPANEKEEAKSLWARVCENKLLNTVLGSASKAATEHVLGGGGLPKHL